MATEERLDRLSLGRTSAAAGFFVQPWFSLSPLRGGRGPCLVAPVFVGDPLVGVSPPSSILGSAHNSGRCRGGPPDAGGIVFPKPGRAFIPLTFAWTRSVGFLVVDFDSEGGDFVFDTLGADDEDVSPPVSARAQPHPYPVMTAAPIPSAAARTPTRPTFVAAAMLWVYPNNGRRARGLRNFIYGIVYLAPDRPHLGSHPLKASWCSVRLSANRAGIAIAAISDRREEPQWQIVWREKLPLSPAPHVDRDARMRFEWPARGPM